MTDLGGLSLLSLSPFSEDVELVREVLEPLLSDSFTPISKGDSGKRTTKNKKL